MITPVLERNNIKKAILFGSYAKMRASSVSDIDIFIDSGGILNGLNFFSVYNQIEDILNKKLDLIEAADIEKDSQIYKEILSNGVVLYER
jgi:predicted nucleotidyltransferase